MQVRPAPADGQVAVGQTLDVGIEVVDALELYGIDVALSFDPAVVEVVDADPAMEGIQVAMGTFLDPGFAIMNVVDNTSGTVHFATTQLNPSEAKSGSGIVVVVKLRGKQAGAVSPLTITSSEAAKRTGEEIPTQSGSGQVRVVAEVGQAPTATSIPTQAVSTLTPAPTEPAATAPAATATPAPTAGSAAAVTTAPATAAPAATQASAATPLPVQATLAPAVTDAEVLPTPEAGAQAAAAPFTSPVAVVESTPLVGETAVAAAPQATVASAPPVTVVVAPVVDGTVVAAAPAAGIQAQPVQDIPAPETDAAGAQSSRMGTLLLIGGGALVLAAVVIAAFVLLRQRSGRTP